MRSLLLFVFLLSSVIAIIAQPSYMKAFSATGTAQTHLDEMSSGNLLVGLARQSGFSLFSADGSIVHSRNFVVDTFLVLQSVKRHTDNEFYFTGGYRKNICTETGAPRSYPVVGRMDSLGNILDASYYILSAPECSNTAGDIEVLSDGVVVWGTRPARFFAVRTDLDGEPIWAKRFNRSGSFQFIKELPGGDLLAGINMDTASAVVARLDAQGNFLWCRSYIRPKGRVHDAVIESDDSFLITGYTEIATTDMFTPYPPGFHPQLFIMNLNGSGELQWCRGYSSAPYHWYTPHASRIVRAHDGNYVVLANIGVPTQNFWYRPMLMKFDQNGDTLWTRSSGHANYSYETLKLLACSDGGFLLNGIIWGDLPNGDPNWAYLYKTDSLGHLPCVEQYFPILTSELFPMDSSFTLISIDGATRHPAFINDTIYDPLTVYDACTFTTNLPPRMERSRPMSVRPNPNTGHFTVVFPDPLMAESYYSVYDTMGKLLFQRPLPKGKETEEVDLSRFGRGTYVIKFTDKEGSCYERVVVE
jgi:hypothetical protein